MNAKEHSFRSDLWPSLRVVDPVEDPEALEGSAVEGLYAALYTGHAALSSLIHRQKKRNTSLSLMRQACRVFLAKAIYHQRGEVT